MKLYKLIGWYILVAILAWFFWAGIDSLFQYSSVSYENFHLASLILFVFLASILVIGFALFKKWWQAIAAAVIVAGVYIIQTGFTWLNLIGLGVLLLLSWYSQKRATEEVNQRIRVNPRAIIGGGLVALILGMLILVSFDAYQSPAFQGLKKMNQLPSQSEILIRDIAQRIADNQIKNPEERVVVVNQTVSTTVSEINDFLKPYFKYAPPILAFALFLILWGLSWVFVWLGILAGIIIFAILRATHFIIITEEDTKKEDLVT